ncbi:hypothetical protein FHR20_000038 [Sphingomonas leidyi]|uniref:DUF6894 domain-containing protein n=1 Tax=Sphingomonas leidyi TaxID=68569 RepID=A0A7X5UWR6_9SPHN|nr:hypothetical protein [Sphingomonas leidyi]
MPRFFFNVYDRRGWLHDFEGMEVDPSGLRKCAIEQARSLICDDVQHGVLDLRGRIEVTSEASEIVLVLGFNQVVARVLI